MSRGQSRPEGHRPKGISPELRTVSAEEALSIIAAQNAFAKNIATMRPKAEPAFDDPKNGWGFLTRQLQDPEYYRPARKVPEGAVRTSYYDPSKPRYDSSEAEYDPADPNAIAWRMREVREMKGESKPGATFTKKTAVSLLPADGRMLLFSQNDGIVMVFDATKCKVKEQYIFDHNVVSDARWWLYRPDPAKRKNRLMVATTLEVIRAWHNGVRSQKLIPHWNEILPDLCADALIAVAILEFDLVQRLNAQYRRLILRRELNIDVPLLIMNQNKAVYEHTEAMQRQDLADASIFDSGSVEREYFDAIAQLNPAMVSNLPAPIHKINIFQAIRERNLELIELILARDPNYVCRHANDKCPIQVAADLNFWDCVELIANKVETDKNDSPRYQYALSLALQKQELKVARALIMAEAPVDEVTDHPVFKGYYPIHYAIQYKDRALLEAILTKHQTTVVNLKYKQFSVDNGGYREGLVFVGVTPVHLAVLLNNAEFIQLLLKQGANHIDKEILSMVRDPQKWNCALSYCDAVFLNGDDCSSVVGQLLPIASMQRNASAIGKLSEMMFKLQLRIERVNIKATEWSDREKNSAEQLNEFKRIILAPFFQEKLKLFCNESIENHSLMCDAELIKAIAELNTQLKIFHDERNRIDQKEKNEITTSMIALQKDLSAQIAILIEELKPKEVASRAATFFAKIASSYNAGDCEKKKAKTLVLKSAFKLIVTQLSSGGTASKESVVNFEQLLNATAHWNDGKNNRTVPLIERARALIKMPCAKWEESEISEEAVRPAAVACFNSLSDC